jgi:hypothetical protein
MRKYDRVTAYVKLVLRRLDTKAKPPKAKSKHVAGSGIAGPITHPEAWWSTPAVTVARHQSGAQVLAI